MTPPMTGRRRDPGTAGHRPCSPAAPATSTAARLREHEPESDPELGAGEGTEETTPLVAAVAATASSTTTTTTTTSTTTSTATSTSRRGAGTSDAGGSSSRIASEGGSTQPGPSYYYQPPPHPQPEAPPHLVGRHVHSRTFPLPPPPAATVAGVVEEDMGWPTSYHQPHAHESHSQYHTPSSYRQRRTSTVATTDASPTPSSRQAHRPLHHRTSGPALSSPSHRFHDSLESAAAAAFNADYFSPHGQGYPSSQGHGLGQRASMPVLGAGYMSPIRKSSGGATLLGSPAGEERTLSSLPSLHPSTRADGAAGGTTAVAAATTPQQSAHPYVDPFQPYPEEQGERAPSDVGTATLSGWNGTEGRTSHPEDEGFLRAGEGDVSCIDFEALAERLTNSPPALFPAKPGGGGSTTRPTFPTQAHRLGIVEPRFQLYSEAFGAMYADRLEGFDFSRAQLAQPLVETLQRTPFWLDITNPTHHELTILRKIFGIHPLTSEDLETEETREKCEIMFQHYFFVCFRSFDHDRLSWSFMAPVNFYLVVFKECILTLHAKPLPHTANVHRRIAQLKSAFNLSITPDWINYALIDDITDSFGPVLRSIEGEVEAIDDLVLILKESEQTDMLRRIGQSRKRVMQLMRLLGTKSDVVKSIIHRITERLAPGSDTKLYLADIQDHIITMYQNLQHYEKTLGRAHSNYLAQISIEITQASNRTNDVVLKMTLIASVLVPLNIITGLWGMNVEVPGQRESGLTWFLGIVGVMVVLVTVTVWLVRKARLL